MNSLMRETKEFSAKPDPHTSIFKLETNQSMLLK